MALALVHLIFPKYFKWQVELKTLSLVNRQMIYVHTLFIGLTLFLMGLLCYTSSREIVTTHLGNRLALGFGIFWATRLLIQFVGYSSTLWKGRKFETLVHILFALLWTYLSIVFFAVFWMNGNH